MKKKLKKRPIQKPYEPPILELTPIRAHDLGMALVRQLEKLVLDKLKEAQKKCPHKETVYHPDPSGNNDSWHECTRCGDSL